VYDKVAKLTWKKKCMNKNIKIKDSTRMIVKEPEEVREQWRLYIESVYMYDKDGKPNTDDFQVEKKVDIEDDEKGPAVLKSEIFSNYSRNKRRKSCWS